MNELVNGLWCYKPNEKAPDFVKANLSINVDDFNDYLKANQTPAGRVKIDILESKEGKYYAKLNSWTPETAQAEVKEGNEEKTEMSEEIKEIKTEEIPF